MRLQWVDIAKGIGIILVVYGHVLRGLHDAKLGLSEAYFQLSDTFVYGFHMPLFFFLSGMFAVRWVKRDFPAAIWQKTSTLLYPYVIWSMIQGFILIGMSSYTNVGDAGMSPGDLFYRILLAPFGQFWFLYVMFIVFLMFYLFRRLLHDTAILLLSVIPFILAPLFSHTWAFGSLATYFLYFMLGVVAGQSGISDTFLQAKNSLLYSTILFAAINAVYLFTYESINPFILRPFQLIVAIAGIGFILSVSKSLSKIHVPLLTKIGSASMVIYLVHILAGSGTRIVLAKLFHIDNLWLHVILGVLAGVFVPMMVHGMARKINIHTLLFSLNSKKTADA